MTGIADIPVVVSLIQPITAANTKYTASASVGTTSLIVCAANPNRLGLFIYNNSSNSAYINFGAVANSGTAMVVLIPTFSTYSMPGPVIYTGQISAIRNSGSGILMCTELQA